MSASHAVIEPGSRGTVVLAYSGMHARAASTSSFGHSHAVCGAVGVRSCGLDVLQLHVCRTKLASDGAPHDSLALHAPCSWQHYPTQQSLPASTHT
jgi:hypothetical protein